MIPHQIGRYEMRGQIGRGGMATVYLAYDPHFGREVAVKVMSAQLLHDNTFRARFEREAKTIAQLEHPAIVSVYDLGEYQGQPYIVMRLMKGGDLHARLISTPLSVPQAAYLLHPLASALDEAHARGIVHRDLKPANILFDESDRPYITDFGIVKLSQASQKLTGTGDVMGTPAYMSPEQAHGDRTVDGKSDIYSLGVILFEMLTGQVPYQANTPIRLMMKHILEPVPHILTVKADLPAGCEAIIAQAMDKDPNKRFATAGEMSNAFTILAQSLLNPIPAPLPLPPPFQVIPKPTPPHVQSPIASSNRIGNTIPVSSQPIPPNPVPTPPRITPIPPSASAQPKQQYSTGQLVSLGIGIGVVLMLLVVAIMSFGSNGGSRTEAFTATPTDSSAAAVVESTETATATKAATSTKRAPTASATRKPTYTPTVTPTSTPIPPPLTGHLVFVSERDSQENIFIVAADGNQAPQRISDSGLDYAPFWSAATNKIIFPSQREGKLDLYSMAPDGSQVEQLTDSERGITNPLLSQDGSRIALRIDGDLGWITLQTGEVTIHDIYVDGFAWTPDGQRLATTNGDYSNEQESYILVVNVMDVDEPDPNSESIFNGNCDTYDGCNDLVWSPDGQKMALLLAPDEPYEERGIYVIQADGSTLTEIAELENTDESNLVWSPDGQTLLFVAPANRCVGRGIYRVSADGNDRTRLTEDNVSSYSPVWSPDSQRVAYVVFEDGSSEVYVMDADGSNKIRLTDPNDNADEYAPYWSPDGSQIVFASSKYGPNLYVQDLVGNTTQLIASDALGVIHRNPRLSVDGQMLAFSRQYSFSLRRKSVTGGNDETCSSTKLAVISDPLQFGGQEIQESNELPRLGTIHEWSNDGQRLLYANSDSLYFWNMSTNDYTEVENLSSSASRHDDIMLSPDGQQVAYYDYEDDQMYLASLANSEKTHLSLGAEPYSQKPRFSPDGELVLFRVDEGLEVRDLTGTLKHDIRPEFPKQTYEGIGSRHSINEENQILIYPFPDNPASEAGIRDEDILVAIDDLPVTGDTDYISLLKGEAGTDVKMTVLRDGEELSFVVTRQIIELESSGGNIEEYTWLPDSNAIAYEIWESGDESKSTLWLYNLSRQEMTEVAIIPGDLWDLSASHDSLWLAFTKRTTGNDEILAVPTTGGSVVNLTNNPSDDYDPVWIP